MVKNDKPTISNNHEKGKFSIITKNFYAKKQIDKELLKIHLNLTSR